MKTFEDRVKDSLPEGSIYYGVVDSTNPSVLIVEYELNGTVNRGQVKKINLSDNLIDPVQVKYVDGMTYEQLYEKLNTMFDLGLEPEVDYVHKGEIPFTESVMLSMNVKDDSYGYFGTIPVFLYRGNRNLVMDDYQRDLRGLSIHYLLEDRRIQSKLSYKVFTSEGKMFTSSILTMAAKAVLREYLNGFDKTLVEDLVNGYIEKAFNDGLSDMVAMRTQKGYLYFLRFSSRIGDLPS